MPYLAGTLWSGATSNSSTQGRSIKSTKVSFLTVLESHFHGGTFPQGLRTFGGSQCLSIVGTRVETSFQGHYITPPEKSAFYYSHHFVLQLIIMELQKRSI